MEATAGGEFDGGSVTWINKEMGSNPHMTGFGYKIDAAGQSGVVEVAIDYFADDVHGFVTATANIE